MAAPDSADDLHDRARRGISALLARQVFVVALTLGAGIVLARLLDPADFGLYAIATFLVSAFGLLGNLGLAPSLIQRRADLTDVDLQVAFTLQQILLSVVFAVLFFSAPGLASLFPESPDETVWLVRVLALSLYLLSWRSMSTLQLERRLQYGRLAWVEAGEALLFQSIAVVLAFAGYGAWSFVWAVLARALVGTAAVYAIAPWPVRFGFDRARAREIVGFGLPFQLQSVANQFGAWITPLVVGTIIGPAAVGFLTFASSNARKPLMLVDNVMRVAFPHFARIQDDRDEVRRLLSRYLTLLLLPAGLWFAVILVAGPSLVTVIYTEKWEPAVLALVLFAAALSLDVVAWVLGVAFNSLGFVGPTTRVVLVKNAVTLALGVPLVLAVGFEGVAIAYLVAAAAAIPALAFSVRELATARLLLASSWFAVPTMASAAVGALAVRLAGSPAAEAALGTAAVILMFAAVLAVTGPAWWRELVLARVGRSPVPAASPARAIEAKSRP